MKKLTATLFVCLLGTLISVGASATVPDLLPMQGFLTDDTGAPVDALTDITFTLYDDSAGTTNLWTDTFSDVDVANGFFSVYLGSNTALDLSSLLSNAEIWVGMTVGTDNEMDRFQLTMVPFAIEAQTCESVGSLTETDINNNFLPSTYLPDWNDLTNVPADFADGTDDGFTTESELTTLLDDNYLSASSAAAAITSGDITNWDTAYGWGPHSAAGYLMAETDPVFGASAAAGIAASDIANWNTAYGWGDHSGLYSPITHDHDGSYYTETEMQTSGSASVHWDNLTNVPASIADGTDDVINVGVEFTGGNQSITVAAGGTTARSISVTVPEAGYVKVDASAYVALNGTGEDIIRCSINNAAALDTSYLVAVGDHGNTDTYEVYDDIASTRVFTVAAGTHTYYMYCACYRGTCGIDDTNLNAFFVPNRY